VTFAPFGRAAVDRMAASAPESTATSRQPRSHQPAAIGAKPHRPSSIVFGRCGLRIP
jgi:hypothetical protein